MEEVTPDVTRLKLKGVNAYLDLSDGVTLVDTGTPWDAGTIQAALQEAGFTLQDVDRVLITHYDIDHVGGLPKLAAELDAVAYMMEPDRGYLTGEGKPSPWNQKGAFHRIVRHIVRTPDIQVEEVEDGDTVAGYRAVHTPGHTPGHTAYLDRERGICFLGDLVMEKNGGFKVPFRALNYSTNQVKSSIQDLARHAPDIEVGCMGHGDPVGRDAGEKLRELAER